MKFEIRHQISDLEEEIYLFQLFCDSIVYNGFYSSTRKNVNEPFGNDWAEYYLEAKLKEIKALEEKYGDEIHDWDSPLSALLQEVYDKYNPTTHGLLSGTTSRYIAKEHPLKISKELVINTLIDKVKQMEIK